MKTTWLSAGIAGALACLATGAAHAQDDAGKADKPKVTELGKVQVDGVAPGYATQAQYHTAQADLGPLGRKSIQDTPVSVTVVPEQLIVNQQAKTVNDVLRSLPSVEIRDQQGLEVSRPQSRGFQGSIVQNVRIDGLNAIGTTAIPAENLGGIAVLNGMAGALYGPETPAGVFDYRLKRPTQEPLERFVESFDSRHIFTEQIDLGGMAEPDGRLGYRLNVVHGEGESYVRGSNSNRTLFSGALDYHFSDATVLETNVSHYETSIDGLPGSIVYDSGKSTVLPRAVDPTTKGLGQPGAGTDLITSTVLAKLKHDFGDGWHFEAGGLYQDAIRNLFGITNTFTDNLGDYTVTKNFNAVPRFTIVSNMARLNGSVELFGLDNDVSIGTNGFDNGQYSYRKSIATPLGSANLDDPVIFPGKPVPDNGGRYKSGALVEQSFILGDTVHFDERWAVQAVANASYIDSKSYNASGAETSHDSRDGVVSPTVSVVYKPAPDLTTYATFARSVEEGEQAPAGTANATEFMSPYHDKQYELGAKYAASDDLLLTLAAFRMTRPLAITDAATNVFSVVGTQRNIGAELFAQGSVTHELSILGGVTYVNAKLIGTGVPATDDKLVVGVPRVKSDISLDYHPDFAPGFALTGTLHEEGRRAATNTNNSFAPGYATLDFGARYAMGFLTHALTLRLQVINVTDKHYYSSVADGNIVGSPGANTAYFGAPRTWLASAELDL